MTTKSVVAKNRFHKGITSYFRKTLRGAGVSLDEEMAQFVLAGVMPFEGVPTQLINEVRDEALTRRHELTSEWEEANPKKSPFPPSFPDRVLRLVRQAVDAAGPDTDGEVMLALSKLEAIADAETRNDVFAPGDDVPA